MNCGCSSADSSCSMHLYILNNTGAGPRGGTMTLRSAAFVVFAPGALLALPASSSVQLGAWANDWDGSGSISYNMPDGEVLTITYTGGSLDDVNATFPTSSQNYYATKSTYEDGILISLELQQQSAAS